jgi:mannose-6-phosphate isomerase-like protein (cupin superfamily)
MHTDVHKKGELQPEQWTQERCYITELLNSPGTPEYSLAIARVESGVTTQLHSLSGIRETYIVFEGEGEMEVGGTRFTITAGDRVEIPAGVSQRVTAAGNSDLSFYCLCAPRFDQGCYVNLET